MASSSAEEEAGAQVHLKFAVDTAPHRTDGGAAAELEETAVTMSAEKFQVSREVTQRALQ